MRIAIDTSVITPAYLENDARLIDRSFQHLAKKLPEHQFIFFERRLKDDATDDGPNVTRTHATWVLKHRLLSRYWFAHKLRRALRKWRADVFVAIGYCPPLKTIPATIIIPDGDLSAHASNSGKSFFKLWKSQLPEAWDMAASIIINSMHAKRQLECNYRIRAEKLVVVYGTPEDGFKSITHESAQQVKHKFSGGVEYFLYLAFCDDKRGLMDLLKAFSIFKKRQQSNFKLLVIDQTPGTTIRRLNELKTYKYRNDVKILHNLEHQELVAIVGSAYALVYASINTFQVPALNAIKCDVPVIASMNGSISEILNDGALYFTAQKIDELADKMMMLYKDEDLRFQLISKSKIVLSKLSIDRTAESLWEGILKAVK